MAEKKYCPLSFNAHGHESPYCQEEKCEWWDNLAGDCVIVVIAKLGLEGSFDAIRREAKRRGE